MTFVLFSVKIPTYNFLPLISKEFAEPLLFEIGLSSKFSTIFVSLFLNLYIKATIVTENNSRITIPSEITIFLRF